MKLENLSVGGWCAAVGLFVLTGAGCDTGFGQPCSLPKTEQIRRACSEAPGSEDLEDGEIERSSKPSCAVRNFAGCETGVCMVYQGSSSFCSETCVADDDCEGSAVCRPLLGDSDLDSAACEPRANGAPADCYCVRKGDL